VKAQIIQFFIQEKPKKYFEVGAGRQLVPLGTSRAIFKAQLRQFTP
jgi:hypothetical protein